MLRRRSRDRRDRKPRETQPAVQKAAATKRRARPDAVVPEELKLSGHPGRRSRDPGPGSGVILVTGFDPFGGEKTNPSWEICTRLPREIAGLRVETCKVPCQFRRAIEVVGEAIERLHPAIVLSIGQAGGRSRIGVERVAINVDDARIPDNAGAQPVDEMIAANGPPAYFATIPVKAIARAIRAAGIPAEVSNSAGTYVCNHVMYGVLHFLAASGNRARAGFIHVPYAESQVLDKRDAPAMSLESMTKAIEAAIHAAVENRQDIGVPEGALD
jgi:pyroglutamyl-peptidase